MRLISARVCLLTGLTAAAMFVPGTGASISAQSTAEARVDALARPTMAATLPVRAAQAQAAAAQPQVRRLSVEEAVRLALENNLGIQIARFDPLVEDLSIVVARTGWTPSLTNTFQTNSQDSPANSFLSGAQGGKTTSDQLQNNIGVQQTLKRGGGNYSIGWDTSRQTTNNSFSTFSPQLRSSLSLSFTQPLMRGFSIDSIRQQLEVSLKNREISDVQLRQTIATTLRTVRNAYWNLAYAAASLLVQQQSLDLARESLRNTRARVEIGTTPPIDIVEAEAEVALREEAAIVAEGQIATAEDTLRTLVYDPAMADFWSIRVEAVDLPPFQPITVNADAAIRTALDRRTDLQQSKKSLEVTDVNIRYYRDQMRPDVSATFDYGLSGLGGTQTVGGFNPFAPSTSTPAEELSRGFGPVLGDIFRNSYPNWTAGLRISYPLGTSQAEASLARVGLQRSQALTQIKSQELQVTSQVREQARQVQTNQKRVETSRASRGLAERRLEAEQRKFAAGTSTTFIVFQAQRDLAQARNNELRAILDYNQSLVDLETVQEVPLGGAVAR